MSKTSNRIFAINIPKPRTFSKEIIKQNKKHQIKRISNKTISKPSVSSLEKYGVTHSKPLQVEFLKHDDVLLSYKLYATNQENNRHKHNLGVDLIHKYKIAYTDLRKRLYVEDPPDDVRAVTDIDDGYFKYLTDKPSETYIPLFKSLQCLYSEGIRLRHEIGYRLDCILNIETNHKKELEVYNLSLKRYNQQLKAFDTYVSEDYNKSLEYLKRCDYLEVEVNKILTELQNLATKKFTIMSNLIGLDYLYSQQQKYGRFLYYLSPPSWRARHREFAQSVEIEAKGFDFDASSEEDTFNMIFDKMKKECFSGLVKPPLYFTRPEQLLDVFEGIEQQQLHFYSRVTYLAPHAKMLKKGIKWLKEEIILDSALVQHMIKRFETLLEFSDDREKHLQAKFLKIINGIFYEHVGSPEVLKLKLHLDFSLEQIYKDRSPGHTDMFTVAKDLEGFYLNFSSKLDMLHNDQVNKAMKQSIEAERTKMRKAKIASRELRSFDRLERELLLAFKTQDHNNQSAKLPPIRGRGCKKLKGKISKYSVKESIQHELTEVEREYLTLFTDWTDKEDPGNYLHTSSITNDNESVKSNT